MSDTKDEKEEAAKKPSNKNIFKPMTDACVNGSKYVKKHYKQVISCAAAGVILLLVRKMVKSKCSETKDTHSSA